MSEWLDNIKNQLGQADKFLNENGNQAVEVTVSVMNKLIQQAERAEELDKRGSALANDFIKIKKENQRYKQALEEIRKTTVQDYFKTDIYVIASEALEGK